MSYIRDKFRKSASNVEYGFVYILTFYKPYNVWNLKLILDDPHSTATSTLQDILFNSISSATSLLLLRILKFQICSIASQVAKPETVRTQNQIQKWWLKTSTFPPRLSPRNHPWPTLLAGFTMEKLVLSHSSGSHSQVHPSTSFQSLLFLLSHLLLPIPLPVPAALNTPSKTLAPKQSF